MTHEIEILSATADDQKKVAMFATIAGGGLFEYFLDDAPLAKTAEAVGLLLSVLEDGFCLNNAMLAKIGDAVAGSIICYPSSEFAGIDAFGAFIQPHLLEPVRDLFQPLPKNSFYVHSLAVDKQHLRKGVASTLLEFAEDAARALGLNSVCLHVWADNADAVSMYNRNGYITDQIIQIKQGTPIPHEGGMLLVSKKII